MYQLHHGYSDERSLRSFFESVADRMAEEGSSRVLFHFFNDTAVRSVTDDAVAVLKDVMPEAPYVGCSTSGNILDGKFVDGQAPNLMVVADVFEDPTTHVEVFQFKLDEEHRASTEAAVLKLVEERPWVKAVEMISTVIDVSMYDFCVGLSAISEDVVIFGGGALSTETIDMFQGLPYVFSSEGEDDGHGIAFVLYGGDSFYACTQAIIGWKPLGMPMTMTRAEGPVVYELDGHPAYERYHHYLAIEDDESFSDNSLIFPLAIEYGKEIVIKAPVQVGEDGSITLTSDLSREQTQCRIAYGDPATILRSIKESARVIQQFNPQAILAYSCAARLMYWGVEYVSRETLPFAPLAPTAGFYTGGEFSRYGKRLVHHNVTLVVAAMCEGDAGIPDDAEIQINETEFSRQMAIVSSLASFIGVTSAELQDAYDQMEFIAKHDGLTGVANRLEIETQIERALAACDEGGNAAPVCIIMIDLDDFKRVNDRYGHTAGDEVLCGLGALLRAIVDDGGIGCSGRWGGEEFMVLLPSTSIDRARVIAGELVHAFAAKAFPASGGHTMSAGVAERLPGESLDLLFSRVDKALYAAKKQGKNCVVEA